MDAVIAQRLAQMTRSRSKRASNEQQLLTDARPQYSATKREPVKNPQVGAWLTRRDGLADQLRRARGAITARQFAIDARWHDGSKVSKIESGRQLPTVEDLEKWAEITGTPDTVLQQWRAMLVEARAFRRDYVRRLRNGNAEAAEDHGLQIEQSEVFRMFETFAIPRFLQVLDYAKALLAASHRMHGGVEDVDAVAESRLASQRFLYDNSRTFEFIVAEPALRWGIAAPAVMHAQLDRLLSVIGVPRIRLGIIPLGVPLTYLPEHSFELYGDVGAVEGYLGEFKETGSRWERLNGIMDLLWGDAVEGDAARRIILAAKADLPAGN